MSEPNQEALLKIVKDLQSDVGIARSRVTNQAKANVADFTMYPASVSTDKADMIGIIVDDNFNVTQLLSAGKINPPDKLRWLHFKSYDELEEFLIVKGIPAYISFDGDLGVKGKNGLDCAKRYMVYAKKAKLKELKAWECHSPTITSKDAIEFALHSY